MNRKTRDCFDALRKLSDHYGVMIEFKKTSNSHVRITLSKGSKSIVVFTSGTPGDWRTGLNTISKCRRAMEALS